MAPTAVGIHPSSLRSSRMVPSYHMNSWRGPVALGSPALWEGADPGLAPPPSALQLHAQNKQTGSIEILWCSAQLFRGGPGRSQTLTFVCSHRGDRRRDVLSRG